MGELKAEYKMLCNKPVPLKDFTSTAVMWLKEQPGVTFKENDWIDQKTVRKVFCCCKLAPPKPAAGGAPQVPAAGR